MNNSSIEQKNLPNLFPDKPLNNIFDNFLIEKNKILTSSILLNIEENSKIHFNLFLIIFIIIANIILITLRYTTQKDNKDYINYYNNLYYDLIKYLLVESAIIVSDAIETNKFNLTSSLARVSIVLIALLIFHSVKDKIGINKKY